MTTHKSLLPEESASSEKYVVLYHSHCLDGFGAAYAVRAYMKDTNKSCEYIPVNYKDKNLPNVCGKHVIIVDFSYPEHILDTMSNDCLSITILDHHKSAQKDLVKIAPIPDGPFVPYAWPFPRIYAMFDMGRSGTGIAWDYFFPNQRRPGWVNFIEDRDLWRFKIPTTKDFNAAMFSYEYDFELWDELLLLKPVTDLIAEGVSINRKHNKDIKELLGVMTQKMSIAGYVVPAANLPYTYASDAANILAQGAPFAICYSDGADSRSYSLRSVDGGVDVSVIAKKYGGGGHEHAAAFSVPLNKIDVEIPDLMLVN